ncbi:uncharacterized protein LOC143463246 [Clavelina lepadiformis]|uniref:Uncharacterized protein n=1 Tax=Clavelina lepadiformis TaxID=159417 RepID=A0ABP0FK87_CLALP
MENEDDLTNYEEELTFVNRQAKRVKKLTKKSKVLAKQAKLQNEKVFDLTNKAAMEIADHVENCFNEKESEETKELQTKLKDLLSSSSHIKSSASTELANEPSQRGLKVLPGVGIDHSLPFGPSLTNLDDVTSDETSDTNSEFFPDWSSADSCASSVCSRTKLTRSRIEEGYEFEEASLSDDDVLRLSDDEFDDDEIDLCIPNDQPEIVGFDTGILQPIPAAGNDVPETSNDAGRFLQVNTTTDNNAVKSHVLRRVKSMVMENDLEDGVAVGQRMFILQQKRNTLSMTTQPSPLLSTHDVTSLKKTPSQINTRYSLKRSRSSLSNQMTPYKRGDVNLLKIDVIQEEDTEAE